MAKNTFTMECYEALQKCGPVLEEAPAVFDKAASTMQAIAVDSDVPVIKKAAEQITEVAANDKKRLEALTATYTDAMKDYEEIGRISGHIQ